MHEDVKRFYIEGEVSYEYLAKARQSLVESVEDRMRTQGYVPLLDMDPQLTQKYTDGKFILCISVYGGYVGDSAWDTAGLMNGKQIARYTQRPKSKVS